MKILLTITLAVTFFCGQTLAADNEMVEYAPRSKALNQQLQKALSNKSSEYQPRTEHLHEDGSPLYVNRLILEDSPYLIQHAHNPVDWYPWGPEAFAAARRENKPIFLSIGYSTCHWCHVMERESFENPIIADTMNQNFINIKVDRERRPDVDKTYMQAVMLIAGNGGWPMSSFLTSDGKPFFGGTYFPPDAFADLLLRVNQLWTLQHQQLMTQAEQVSEALQQLSSRQVTAGQLGEDAMQRTVQQALYSHDELQGGFGQAPKFPQEPLLLLLLAEVERRNNTEVLAAVETTLDAMSRGGIYDQVGGGFHRYSTDNAWLVPHFEKMLYNQAHLARAFLLAWRLTGKPDYQRVAKQTFDYVLRDMTSDQGAFYSATDADSEGEEGIYFLWTPEQIRESLSAGDAEFAIDLFDMSDIGNFEGRNIPNLPDSLADFALQKKLPLKHVYQRLDKIREQLYQTREQRQKPLRDEKILTAWNGMMITAMAQAGDLLKQKDYLEAAERAAEFVWNKNRLKKGELARVHLQGSSSIEAQQEDYAYFAEALLQLYDITGNTIWLQRAQQLSDDMLKHFWDEKSAGFYMSRAEGQLTSLGRPLDDGYDNAIPSGSSVALRVLQKLDARRADFKYARHINAMLSAFANSIQQSPINFAYMLAAATDYREGELGAIRYVARGGVRAQIRQIDDQQVVVELSIPPGWHVNSNQPLQKGLIPTSLSIAESDAGWQLQSTDYPEPVEATLGFQKEALSLYKGQTKIELAVKAAENAARILPVQLHIQACNDRICLPPEKVTLRLPMDKSVSGLIDQ